jgi:hypothetical protein
MKTTSLYAIIGDNDKAIGFPNKNGKIKNIYIQKKSKK